MLWCIRAAAAAAIVIGVTLIARRLIFAIMIGNLQIAWDSYEGIGQGHEFSWGFVLVVVGAAAGLASRRLAAWIICMPPDACPRCEYGGVGKQARCSECGLEGFSPAATAA